MSNYENSQEIRHDIDETRRDMGRKIDAIQHQLSPEHLKAKARDVVNEVATSTADSLSEYIRDNMGNMGNSLANALKRNPIPTALVGLGLGWLMVESFSSDSTTSRYPIQRYRATGRYGTNAGYTPYHTETTYSPAYAGSIDNGSASNGNEQGIVDQVKDTMSNATDAAQRKAEQWMNRTKENVNDAAYEAQRLRDEARLQSHLAAMDAQDRVAEWQQQGRSWSQEASRGAQRGVDDAAGYVGNAAHEATNYAYQTAEQVGSYASYATNQAQHYSRQAGRRAYAAGEQVVETMEENPVTFGLITLAAGVAIGMLLPQTRRENEWIGQYSDQFADAARATATDVAHHAQEAYEEIRPEVERSTQKVMNELKETGRSVVEDLKQTGQTVKEEAKEVGDHAATVAEKKGEEAKADAKDHAKSGLST